MSRLILKCPYLKGGGKRTSAHLENLVNYIATRDGMNSASAPLSKLMQYKTFYDTLRDLDYKIKISFTKAIEYAYSERLQEDFTLFQESSIEETYSYYLKRINLSHMSNNDCD